MAVNLLDVGVSRRALSIARMIDRLPPGKFNIVLIKADHEGERWQIQIDQPITLQKKELLHEPAELLPCGHPVSSLVKLGFGKLPYCEECERGKGPKSFFCEQHSAIYTGSKCPACSSNEQ